MLARYPNFVEGLLKTFPNIGLDKNKFWACMCLLLSLRFLLICHNLCYSFLCPRFDFPFSFCFFYNNLFTKVKPFTQKKTAMLPMSFQQPLGFVKNYIYTPLYMAIVVYCESIILFEYYFFGISYFNYVLF